MKLSEFLIVGLLAAILLIGVGILGSSKSGELGAVGRSVNTFTSGWTNSTSSITGGAATTTRVFASVTNLATIFNTSNSYIDCLLSATNATSSIAPGGQGVKIGPVNSTTSSLPSQVTFGECSSDLYNCFPHKGAVNCQAGVTSTVNVLTR